VPGHDKPSRRSFVSNPGLHHGVPSLPRDRELDLWLYAHAFHQAAKTLAGALKHEAGPIADRDISPVVFMYRQAVELHLKALVLGEGGNFLAAKPDALSVHRTHSVPWLAQFVSQIITTVKWEKEFKCEGVGNLAEFKAVIEELNAVDPGSYVFRLPVDSQAHFGVRDFACRMDALLELLDSTADALAAV
jgi:hypothetical protein